MKLDQLLLPGTALVGAALLLAPRQVLGFDTSGESLSLSQRDVRVFNNFTDATANDNTTPDPNWPGYVGAELAIWKSAGEWGSMLHGGTGAGDPLQTVGSGGANFDFSWQGRATEIGSTNDNTHSELFGDGGGVLAFIEVPISDGWRCRYYSAVEWQDGPGSVLTGFDLQGVATFLHGIALGLLPTSVPGATMNNVISGSDEHMRSIEADDIAGVRFVYGVKSASKPVITNVAVSSGIVTILGSNFSATGNEVWFTRAGAGGTGDPVKVTAVNSNGTSISVAIPAEAGPGDVLVRNSGTANSSLSNAWPVDPNSVCNALVYCTAKVSSNLCQPSIGFSGVPSISAAGSFSITTTVMEFGVSAIDFFGTNGQAAVPFQGALMCAVGPIHRLGGKFTGGTGTCTGSISYTLQDVIDHASGGPLVSVGGVVNIQSWGRDLGDVFGSSLSNALEITVCP